MISSFSDKEAKVAIIIKYSKMPSHGNNMNMSNVIIPFYNFKNTSK